MAYLKVAIFGRPNVGKSTLFNQLTETRRAVVKDQPGVTRDVQRGTAEWCGVKFELFDAAGVSADSSEVWSRSARDKALSSAKEADKVVFVLDGKYGINPEDQELSRFVKQLQKPVLAVVNKLDNLDGHDLGLAEFYALGFDDLLAVSFEHKLNVDELLDWIIDGEDKNRGDEEDKVIRLGVFGKPNAGKSTLVNQILGEERSIASSKAGTTVDSIEEEFEKDGQRFRIIDTAGLRRHAKRQDAVEYVSAKKAEQTIEESDLLLLVIDGLVGSSQQDARLIELALSHHKPSILVVNKVDEAEKKIPALRKTTRERIAWDFHFFKDVPIVFVSAKTGKGMDQLFSLIQSIWKKVNRRISTPELNQFLFDVIRKAPAPSYNNKDIKFYYMTQTQQRPPAFMTFVNDPRGVNKAYRRFVIARLKEQYDLSGVPVRIYPKKRRHIRQIVKSYGEGPRPEENPAHE